MGKHKDPQDYWGYLVQPDKSPTPLFQELLIAIAHYITKHVAPWEARTLTPSKLANFYRLVGGNYDSLFLESPNVSIAFIYKSLGCYHSLQPSKDPFAAPSIPALTNDGFVRWQTVQLLLGPDEHVPYLQEAVKRFELKNPMDGEPFPRHLPIECLPRAADPEMTRWHDAVGERLFRACGTEGGAPAPLPLDSEGRHVADIGAYVQSPPSSARPRPPSFGRDGAPPPEVRPHRSVAAPPPGLQAPPANVRRHSVPDRARGSDPALAPAARVFTPPLQKQPTPNQPQRNPSQDATAWAEDGYFSRPTARQQDSSRSHGRSGSAGSAHVRHPAVRSLSHDRPVSHGHSTSSSRSPPRAHAMPPPGSSQQRARPPLSANDSGGRRHTMFVPSAGPGPAPGKEYVVRPDGYISTKDQIPRFDSYAGSSKDHPHRSGSAQRSPPFYAPAAGQSRHGSLSGPPLAGSSPSMPPIAGSAPPSTSQPMGNILEGQPMQASPPHHPVSMASQGPPPPPAAQALPPHLRHHPASAQPPNQAFQHQQPHPAYPPQAPPMPPTSRDRRPPSSSSDPHLSAPGSAPVPPSATFAPPSSGGAYVPTPLPAGTTAGPSSPHPATGAERARRRTIDELVRDKDRHRAGEDKGRGRTSDDRPRPRAGDDRSRTIDERDRARPSDDKARGRTSDERDRAREEMEFELNRRRQRHAGEHRGSGGSGSGSGGGGPGGRSRSGGREQVREAVLG